MNDCPKTSEPRDGSASIEAQIRLTAEAHLALIAQGGVAAIVQMSDAIAAALRSGHRLYIMGNGGSAAQAQHMAGEIVGRFMCERSGWPAQALSVDTSVLTAVANDYGYDAVFERQVQAFVLPGDAVLALSTSGNSLNVARALVLARKLGARTLALSGRGGGRMKDLADACLVTPDMADTSPRVQELHLTIIHVLCGLVEDAMTSGAASQA